MEVGEGAAVYEYPQDEDASTLWYHDDSLGLTRLNVSAGLAGLWLVRDDLEGTLDLPGPAPQVGERSDTRYYEIPLLIQDRTFLDDGSLSSPESLGTTMVVNGKAWPFLDVEPRLYRFRMLNASDARTLALSFDDARLEFVQIGGDGGFVPGAPVRTKELLMGAAERYDVLVDFGALSAGDVITLRNGGPDEAWRGPDANPRQNPADPRTTGQVMQFRVVARTSAGRAGSIPKELPPIRKLSTSAPRRDLLLQERTVGGDLPNQALLGTVTLGPLPWEAPVSEVVRLNATEDWRIANATGDVHPIHVHLVDFQVVDRRPFNVDDFKNVENEWLSGKGPRPALDDFISGAASPPGPTETSEKDTVLVYPGTVTRIRARFDRAGSYVWHGHIIEHEDEDMMRPLEIVPAP